MPKQLEGEVYIFTGIYQGASDIYPLIRRRVTERKNLSDDDAKKLASGLLKKEQKYGIKEIIIRQGKREIAKISL